MARGVGRALKKAPPFPALQIRIPWTSLLSGRFVQHEAGRRTLASSAARSVGCMPRTCARASSCRYVNAYAGSLYAHNAPPRCAALLTARPQTALRRTHRWLLGRRRGERGGNGPRQKPAKRWRRERGWWRWPPAVDCMYMPRPCVPKMPISAPLSTFYRVQVFSAARRLFAFRGKRGLDRPARTQTDAGRCLVARGGSEIKRTPGRHDLVSEQRLGSNYEHALAAAFKGARRWRYLSPACLCPDRAHATGAAGRTSWSPGCRAVTCSLQDLSLERGVRAFPRLPGIRLCLCPVPQV